MVYWHIKCDVNCKNKEKDGFCKILRSIKKPEENEVMLSHCGFFGVK